MDSTMSTQSNRNFWKSEENLLKQWADKAQCYQWMHSRSHDIYSRKRIIHHPCYHYFHNHRYRQFCQRAFRRRYSHLCCYQHRYSFHYCRYYYYYLSVLKIAELNEAIEYHHYLGVNSIEI